MAIIPIAMLAIHVLAGCALLHSFSALVGSLADGAVVLRLCLANFDQLLAQAFFPGPCAFVKLSTSSACLLVHTRILVPSRVRVNSLPVHPKTPDQK